MPQALLETPEQLRMVSCAVVWGRGVARQPEELEEPSQLKWVLFLLASGFCDLRQPGWR